MKRKTKIIDIWKNNNINKEIFWNNEVRANMLNAKVILIFASTTLLLYILESLQTENYVYLSNANYSINICLGIIVSSICFYYKGERKWLKYLMVGYLQLAPIMLLYFSDSTVVLLAMILPLVISCRYYNEHFTRMIAIVCMAMITLSIALITNFNITTMPNLNYAKLKPGIVKEVSDILYKQIVFEDIDLSFYFFSTMRYITIPSIVIFIIVSYICVVVAKAGKAIVIKQDLYAREAEKINAELHFASKIQNDMLPKEVINNEYVEISGKMIPAKEVGGDFYDYFVIDDEHVAITIGDVSDKGVPAALFMSKCKTLIKGYAINEYPVDYIYSTTNVALCENNASGMFVTSFLAILNVKTGEISYSNAGHCLPILIDENNNVRTIDVKPNLFLGAMEDEKYNCFNDVLKPGSRLIIYTDGVTEAMDSSDNQYGTKRLIDYANRNKDVLHNELIENLYKDIDSFVNGAEQHDDITVLVLDYKKR